MKKLKYIIIFILSLGMFNSCLDDDDMNFDLNDDGKNLAGFATNVIAVAAISDGDEYDFDFKMNVTGPTYMTVSNDIEVTVSVVPVSGNDTTTAIEGTHYRIDNPVITLSEANNHLGKVVVTMLTDGIETPLEKSPVLVLEVTSASGDNNVIANGKTIAITLNYACPSFLAGDYSVVTTRGDGRVVSWTETITETGIGEYVTEYVGTWDPPLNPDWGFIFADVCNVISVPIQDLADMYSNEVWGHSEGEVNPAGVITIHYTISFDAGNNTYTSVYTPI